MLLNSSQLRRACQACRAVMRNRVRANAKKEGPDLRAHLAKKRAHAAAGQRVEPPSTNYQMADAIPKKRSARSSGENQASEQRDYWGVPVGKEYW